VNTGLATEKTDKGKTTQLSPAGRSNSDLKDELQRTRDQQTAAGPGTMGETSELPKVQDLQGWINQPRDSMQTHDDFLMKRQGVLSRERQEDTVTSQNKASSSQ